MLGDPKKRDLADGMVQSMMGNQGTVKQCKTYTKK